MYLGDRTNTYLHCAPPTTRAVVRCGRRRRGKRAENGTSTGRAPVDSHHIHTTQASLLTAPARANVACRGVDAPRVRVRASAWLPLRPLGTQRVGRRYARWATRAIYLSFTAVPGPPNSALHATPLTRPVSWVFLCQSFRARPRLAPQPTSGARKRRRWACVPLPSMALYRTAREV